MTQRLIVAARSRRLVSARRDCHLVIGVVDLSAMAVEFGVGVSLIISGVTRVMMSVVVRKATDMISPKIAA